MVLQVEFHVEEKKGEETEEFLTFYDPGKCIKKMRDFSSQGSPL